MLRWFKQTQMRRGGGKVNEPENHNVILVKNDSGNGVGRFGVLGLDEPLFDPDDSESAFLNNFAHVGVTPAAAHEGNFCVTLEPINDGKIGRAVVSGIVPVRLDVTDELTNLKYCFADISVGSTTALVAGYSGAAAIVWKASGSGTSVMAKVNLGGRAQRLRRWAKFKEASGTWSVDEELTLDLCNEARNSLSLDIEATNVFAPVNKTTSKNVLLMGSGRKLVLDNVDPC